MRAVDALQGAGQPGAPRLNQKNNATGGTEMIGTCAVTAGVDHVVDWESPAGPIEDDARPMRRLPGFIFTGPGDVHWIGQRCDVLGALPGDPSLRLVRLTCGCRVHVPRSALQSA